MLTLIVSLVLSLPVVQEPPAYDAEVVEGAVASLSVALKDESVAVRIDALRGAARVRHARVAKAIAGALKDGEEGVRDAALDALRGMKIAGSLKELTIFGKKTRALKEDPELHAKVLKAIAWHGNPGSIDLLTDKVFATPDHAVIRARILGLGMIRSKASVEALFDLMKSAGRHKVQPFMRDMRLALMVLTGADQGQSQDLWLKWWASNKKELTVAPEAPKLPRAEQYRWDEYWGIERKRERTRRRGERGQDPER